MDSASSRVSMPRPRKFIGAGVSGHVYSIDKTTVFKMCLDPNRTDLEVERRAYERLGSHPSIAGYFGATDDGSTIILERGKCLRDVYKDANARDIPISKKLRWANEVAMGLHYIHEKGIIHADVGCGNLILTRDDHLKFIDFAGSSIDGEAATVSYEWFSYRASIPEISIQTDIFAYGCTIFEIETGKPPYNELRLNSERMTLVEKLYQEHKFADVRNLTLGDVIQNCWDNNYQSMDEVIQALSVQIQKTDMTYQTQPFGTRTTTAYNSICYWGQRLLAIVKVKTRWIDISVRALKGKRRTSN